jgi:peptide/nickel transport system substrate-binding protein
MRSGEAMKRTLVLLVLVIAMVGILVAGCGDETTETTAATAGSSTTTGPVTTVGPVTTAGTDTTAAEVDKHGGTLTVSISQGPMSPGGLPFELIANDSATLQTIFEPLFRGNEAAEPQPWLAESYKVADDMMSMDITLKKGIKFTDGSDLNAEVAAWNIQQVIDNKKVAAWKSVEVVDDLTIRINFTKWDNTAYNAIMDSIYTWMVSKENFDKNGIDYAREHPVGTGPFVFKAYQKDAYFDVERNPNYWQEGLPYLDGIHFVFMNDENTKKASVLTGEVQVMELDPSKVVADLVKEATDYTYVSSIFSSTILVLDTATEESPLYDKKVREALDYAIDRESLASALGYGLWTAQYQIASPADTGVYDASYVYPRPYDPEKAKALLAEAGYPNGGVEVTIYASPAPIDPAIMTAVQDMLKQVGINAEVVFCTSQTEFDKYDEGGKPGSIIFQPMAAIGNYNGALSYAFSPDIIPPTYNRHWLRTPEYTDLYHKSTEAASFDPALAKACLDYMLETDVSVLPVSGSGKGWLVANNVMDGGWFSRSFCPWWTPEAVYIAK